MVGVCLLGLGLLAGCDRASDACFPVPTGDAVAVGGAGMEANGTGLQSTPPDEDLQGTSLQGAGPGEDVQGTSLQGATPGEEDQGTNLQGGRATRAYRGLDDLNGASLALEADAGSVVTLRDGQLVATGFPDTAALQGVAITATAPDGRQFTVEVAAVILDGRTQRVELSVDGLPVCDREMHGLFVPGRWDARGTHVADPDIVTYSCMDGVIAKCVSWGYAPWLTDADVHSACTRLARADYCGNGTPWTLDGTHVNIYDQLGIGAPATAGTMQFEAAWGPGGAICAARTRYEIHDDAGHTLEPSCFASLPRCTSLDDDDALGAMLANKSDVTPIAACE